MSAAIASRRSPSRMASAINGSSSTINTRIPLMVRGRAMSSAYRKPHTGSQPPALLNGAVTSSGPARTAARRARSMILAALVVASSALLGVLGYPSLAASSSSTPSPVGTNPVEPRPPESLDGHHGAPSEADGVVPDGVTVFDAEYPAVAKLAPALLGALRQAATAAAANGVRFYVDSGWRSPEYQKELLDDAVSKYGSEKQAARWVATPDTSAHVSGDAVDIGHSDAASWLSKHGSKYGLCQIYSNEPWHYELRPAAVHYGCPARYADPSQDPRMKR